jgi:general secretion pathway protein A
MVLNYYGLAQQPFGVVPDPRFLMMTQTHREALASLTYGLHEERGFLALTAPPGMGKTTLLFHLLERLRGRARTAFIFQTQCDPLNFFRYLIRELGMAPGPDMASMHDQLNQALLSEARNGRSLVLVVDEAQNLDASVLESIRLLSNFESPSRKLMQIIVAGQPGLVETLVRADMEQLRQRISIFASLKPFNQEETSDYIVYRLKIAGHQGPPLFTDDALAMIAQHSDGIPRNVNSMCFSALSLGVALKKYRICREIIEEVVADRAIESLLPDSGGSPADSRSYFGLPAFVQSHLPRRKQANSRH